MNENEIIEKILKLYEKYDVDNEYLIKLEKKMIIIGMKGILEKLDREKKHQYTEEDLVLIKRIYGTCC